MSSILLAGAPDEEAAAELMEWMGMEAFELISTILEHRAVLTGAVLAALALVRHQAKRQAADGKTPSVMTQVKTRSRLGSFPREGRCLGWRACVHTRLGA